VKKRAAKAVAGKHNLLVAGSNPAGGILTKKIKGAIVSRETIAPFIF
jgi:hypothetical protein